MKNKSYTNKSYTINNADGSVVSINFSYEERSGIDYEKLEETLKKVINAKYNHEYLGSIVKIIYAIYEDIKPYAYDSIKMRELEVKIFDKDKNLIEKVKCYNGIPTEYSLYGKNYGNRKYDIEFINGNFRILDVTDESLNNDESLNIDDGFCHCTWAYRNLFENFLHIIRRCEYHPANGFRRFSEDELAEMKYISSIYTKFIGESVDFSKKGVVDTLYNILTILTSLIDEYQQEFHLWPALREYTSGLSRQTINEPYLTLDEHIDYNLNRWVLSEEEKLGFENSYLKNETDYDTIKLIGELIRNSSKIANLSIEETLRILALAYRGCNEDDIPKEYHNFIRQLMMEIDGNLRQRYTINRGKH